MRGVLFALVLLFAGSVRAGDLKVFFSPSLRCENKIVELINKSDERIEAAIYPSGKKEAIFINESNLYKLIFKSNKPAAVQFGDWVTGEVLPTIRKTGGYGTVDMKAIGGMVKRCVNKALSDFLSNELPVAEDEDVLRKKYYNVNDREMMDVFQRWYWSRNYDVRKVIDSQQQRIEELEAKLRMVKQAIN